MKYIVDLTEMAKKDIVKLRKSGEKQAFKKVEHLLNELKIHPTFGTGHPEQLRHRGGNVWSRRITDKHRLVYEIFENIILVEVQQAWGHYDDK